MDSEKKKNLEESFERIINVGLCVVPYEDISDIVVPEVMLFGTTIDEKIYSWDDLDVMLKSQYVQMGDMEPSIDRKRLHTRISEDEKHASIIEEVTLTMASPDEVNSILIRCSCIMEYHDGRWKMTHWHSSSPVDTENDHWHQEEWKREKEKLQALVDQQTADLHRKNRELEIEASIERVRAVAMGMTKPDDMLKVCRVISDQLQQFGVEHIRNVQTVIINEEKGTYHNYQYFTPYDKESFEITECHQNPTVQAMINRMLESPDAFFTTSLTGEELATFRSYRKKENQFPDPLLDDTKSLDGYFFSIGPGGLGITLYRPLNEDGLEIFKRFHNVFSLAYRRFRDIEQAEAQAREAQIQLALERVRARTMAMQTSAELADTAAILFKQLSTLGIAPNRLYIIILNEETGNLEAWGTQEDGKKISQTFRANVDQTPVFQEMFDGWKGGKQSLIIDLKGKKLTAYIRFLSEQLQVPVTIGHTQKRRVQTVAYFAQGLIGMASPEPQPDEIIFILERFAKVFEQTYTRFLDLQKAEAQAQEAEIELSLERIRAQVTAMQESSDLLDIVVTMRTEFVNLGHDAHYFWHMRWLPERYDKAMTSGDGSRIGMVMTLPRHMHGDIEPVAEWEKGNDPTHVLAMDVDTAVDYVDKMISLGDFEQVDPQAPTLDDIRHIGGLTFIMARTTHGEIGFSLPGVVPDPPKDAVDTLVRFAGVFDLAYKRFEDLKAAERQHREAQIELALERVRARTMAMQSSDEFADVAAVLFDQVRTLGGNLWGTGFGLCEEDADNDEFWFANENGVFPAVSIPNTEDPAHKKMYQGWKNKMEFLALEGSGEDLKNHYNYMMTLPEVRPFFQKILDEGLTFPEWQQWNAAYFSHGYLLIITLEPYSNQEILKRFARVFDQTYTRFLDLKKAEAQARESEIQLALERVRARSMAMHQSDELADLSLELVKQVHALGIDTWFCAFNIYDDHPEGSIEWGSNGQGTFPRYRTPREGVFLDYYEAGQRGETLLINEIGEDECPAHYDYLCSLPGVGEQLLKIKDEGIPFPAYQIDHAAFFKYGYILFITFEPVPEAHDIFKRFAKVFQQTYTRFLDLQKSEEQAREAKIEAALERVRARSMGMHKSDDLIDVVREIGKGIHELGIQLHYSQIYTDYTYDPKTGLNVWVTGEGRDYLEKFHIPYIDHSITLNYYNALNEGLDFFSDRYSKAEKDSYFKLLFKYSDLKRVPQERKELVLNASGWTRFTVILNEATLNFGRYTLEEFTDEEHEIFIRFAKVFGQAYTRFLDLKKSEEQVREAEIQLALERVRAKTMAMKTQSDLLGVVELFGEQLKAVGVRFDDVTVIDGPITKSRDWELWSHIPAENGFTRKVHIPYTDTPYFTKTAESVEKYEKTGNPIQVKSFTQSEKNEFLDHYFKHAPAIPDNVVDLVYKNPGSVIVDAFLKEVTVSLVRSDLEPYTDEELEIFERFSKEFRQTYIRFLDIQKSEKQAREAQIEAALERVRSRSLAMQKTNELQDVVRVVAEELKNTGVILDTGGAVICTYFQDSKDVIHWTATDDPAHPSVPYLVPYFEDELFDEAWESKSRGDDYFAKVFSYDVKNAFFSHAFEHSDYRQLPDEYKKIILESKSHGLAWAWAENSAIMIPSIQGDLPSEEEKKTLIRFAKVFEQSFIRFLDLQKAEAQAREARIEASLEKVRAQSMGMQSSEDLSKVASVMFDQMKGLGGELFAFGIVLCNKDKDTVEQWHSLGNEGMIKPFNVPVDLDYIHQYRYDRWKAGEELFSIEIPEDYIARHFDLMFGLPSVKAAMDEVAGQGVDVEIPDWEIDYGASFTYGYLLVSSRKPFEETRIFPRFAKVFDQAYTRFLDLQKAEAQAREAKIEAALEKVRSRTMGMQSSDELPEVANMLFLEVQALGIPAWSSGFNILAEDKKSATAWMSSEGTLMEPFTLRLYGEASFDEMGDFLRRNEPFMVQELGGEALREHYKYMKTFPDLKPAFKKLEEQGLSLPTYQINHLCKFSHGFLLFITYEPVPDAHDIFKRFTNVFDQTYTRFLDLKKAEKQARESRIEAALERVRSRAMAMQSSDELKEVANELRTQMGLLGQKDLEVCAIHLYDLHEDHFESWGAMHPPGSEGEILQSMALIPKSGSLIIDEMMDLYASNETDYILVNEGEKSKQWFDLMEEHVPEIFRHLSKVASGIPFDQFKAYWAMSEFSGGALIMVTHSYPDEDSRNLLRRTARVFGLAYKRFNDLKRAEEQARKAQIENALEKVRSRSLAMQHPDELVEVAQLLREEMGALGVEELETSSIYIHDDTSGLTQCWFTIKDSDDPGKSVTDQMTIDLMDTWVGRQMDEFYRSDKDMTSILMKGDQRIEWIRYSEEKSDLFGKSEFYGDTIPERTYHLYKFSNGFLGAASPGDISEESWDLMRRATGVFSFAYTRFSDLQKAEESARRARQQASLDRVRADISGMRSAKDLNRVTPLIWNELTTLGIPFIRCGVFIMHEDDELVEVYLSKPDGTSLAVMHLPFDANDLTVNAVEAWREKDVYRQHWTKKEFQKWGRSMMESGQIQDMESYQGAEEAPESLNLHFIPFNQGMLYVGSIAPLDDEEISLSESLAKAFSIAYARYEDFVKLEKAKAGIENAMTELKATQSQLVQQEKLASLGQLTAGIAHEIKNPLNFVNNFSELSVELVEEAREEIRDMRLEMGDDESQKSKVKSEKGESPLEGSGEAERSRGVSGEDERPELGDVSDNVSDPSLLLEILDDIEANLKTIHKHGTRADSIVKSMLQHSRGGDGKMEATALNPLIKEYVNLAFHGMRAGNDPINVDIDLQLDDEVGEVPLVAEDFSRVILNLVNNAFDAMKEKVHGKDLQGFQNLGGLEDYQPKLTVRTLQKDQAVTIEIEDNGPGIPDEMKDKILQPFFTTKKGTQGTGLGLSITNDIIKAHGGNLDIESGTAGAVFKIYLPQ